MLYMVIEEYRDGPGPVYERAGKQGRMLPEGWADLINFDVFPVIGSGEAARRTGAR